MHMLAFSDCWWWWKPENPEKTADLGKSTINLSHIHNQTQVAEVTSERHAFAIVHLMEKDRVSCASCLLRFILLSPSNTPVPSSIQSFPLSQPIHQCLIHSHFQKIFKSSWSPKAGMKLNDLPLPDDSFNHVSPIVNLCEHWLSIWEGAL